MLVYIYLAVTIIFFFVHSEKETKYIDKKRQPVKFYILTFIAALLWPITVIFKIARA